MLEPQKRFKVIAIQIPVRASVNLQVHILSGKLLINESSQYFVIAKHNSFNFSNETR
ncbi:MAG: hypothetical protein CLLPBCKN_006304 [Chroococcidiopsis cubana SAG 39.79]|nr:hypothetical protein [Chroococcidiopsis cubana SAG 39.79]